MKKFILSTVIIAFAISCLTTSCSQDEDWGMDEYSTLATKKMTRGSGEGVEYGDSNYYYIPETLLGTSGCAYKAIYNVFGSKYSLDSIQRAMKKFDSNIEYYSTQYLGSAIQQLTNRNVTTITSNISSNSVSVRDIVCVPPKSFSGFTMLYGHATVVSSIEHRNNYTLVRCYDGCCFDVLTLSVVFKTSNIN